MLVAYGVGRRSGRKRAERNAGAPREHGDPECVNYRLFCENYGSCDGQTCEYE
jgi:hypothetical protein